MEQSASNLDESTEPQSLVAGAGAGSNLYVINLCASIAPVDAGGKNLPGLENYRLYQVARVEDGRTRHRLRLGFFSSESHAKSVLTVVRQQYPTAFTTSLCEEDRKFARGYLPQPAPPKPAAVATQPAPPPAKAAPAAKGPAAAAKTAAKDVQATKPKAPAAPAAATAPSAQAARPTPKVNAPAAPTKGPQAQGQPQAAASPAIPAKKQGPSPARPAKAAQPPAARSAPVTAEPAQDRGSLAAPAEAPALTFSDPPAVARPPKPAGAPNQPFHVGRGVQIADLPITLQNDAPRAQRPAQAAPVAPAKPAPASRPANAPAQTAARPQGTTGAARLPDLDSTQTIRALTSAELDDDSQEKWFAIELAASAQPVNLAALPHLDIFEAYRLYCVAIAGGGKIVHSLRLGFFREAVSAEAVCGYLQAFFASPSAVRVSMAEYERFKDAPVRKSQSADLKSPAKVIELSDARAARPSGATLTANLPAPRSDASGSFRRPEPPRSTGASGKYKAPTKKSLQEQLLEEAREAELSASGVRKLPKNDSLLSRLVGKLKNSE